MRKKAEQELLAQAQAVEKAKKEAALAALKEKMANTKSLLDLLPPLNP